MRSSSAANSAPAAAIAAAPRIGTEAPEQTDKTEELMAAVGRLMRRG